MSAVVQSWRLDPASTEKLWERTAKTIRYHQRRKARARKSHAKTANGKLRQLGIKLSTLKTAASDTIAL